MLNFYVVQTWFLDVVLRWWFELSLGRVDGQTSPQLKALTVQKSLKSRKASSILSLHPRVISELRVIVIHISEQLTEVQLLKVI